VDLDTALWITGGAAVVAAVCIAAVTVKGRRDRAEEAEVTRRLAAQEPTPRSQAVQRHAATRQTVQDGDGTLFGSGPAMPSAPAGQRRNPRPVPPLRGGPGHRRTGGGVMPGYDAGPFTNWNSGPMAGGGDSGGSSGSSDSGGSSGSCDSGGSSF